VRTKLDRCADIFRIQKNRIYILTVMYAMAFPRSGVRTPFVAIVLSYLVTFIRVLRNLYHRWRRGQNLRG